MGHESGESPRDAENRWRRQQEAEKNINWRFVYEAEQKAVLLKEQAELEKRLAETKRKLEQYKR